MHKYEVVLAVDLREVNCEHEVLADGIGYHNEGDELMLVLYVNEQAEGEQTGETVERAVFATPVRMLAYVKDLDHEKAE